MSIATGGNPAECPICGMPGLSDLDGSFACPFCEHVWVDGDEEEWLDNPEYAGDPDAWKA